MVVKKIFWERITARELSTSTFLIFILLAAKQSTAIAENFTNSSDALISTIETNTTLAENSSTNSKAQIDNLVDATVEIPQKITRGESVEIKAVVRNIGADVAKNLTINWRLPSNFEPASGSLTENCGDLTPNSSCTSTLLVKTSVSTSLGPNEIGIVVIYE